MIDIFLLIIALLGSILASAFDLKTTEIPDEIPYIMIFLGIFVNLIKSFLVLSYFPFLFSCLFGLSFLFFGFLMYFLGQWGGGDAKLLSAIGFLVPETPFFLEERLFFPFPLSFFFNLFFIGSFYMAFYALIVSFLNKKIWHAFFKDLKAKAKMLIIFNFSLIASILFFFIFTISYFKFFLVKDLFRLIIFIFFFTFFIPIFWSFVKIVEEVGFKKKIQISKLRVGDVLADNKVWEGITKEELKKIKKSGKKYIMIKSGVRFAPAFPLALFFTLFFGDGIIWFAFRFI